MKKIIFIVLAIVLVLVLGVVLFFTLFSPKGYKPGDLAAREDLGDFLAVPGNQEAGDYWQVDDDVSLYFTKSGQGEVVLTLHGGPGFPSTENWKGLDLLAHEYAIYYYHQRGSGLSTRPVDRFESKNYYQNMTEMIDKLGIEQQIADVERIRTILGVEKLNIIGHSFGGFIGALYAMEFPQNVDKLVLVSPANMLVMPHVTENDLYSQVEKSLNDSEREEFRAFMKDYFNYGKIFEKSEKELTDMNNRFGQYYIGAMDGSESNIDVPDVKKGYDNGWMTHAIFFSLGRKYDMRNELKRISCPVLLIHGENDKAMDSDAINTYRDNLPGVVFETISDGGHNSFDDQPEEFARIVGEFLAGE